MKTAEARTRVPTQPLGIVCVSGGMDSAVTAALARHTHRLAFLHVSYGQRTQDRERRAFEQLADHMGVEARLAVSLASLAAIGGSSLTDRSLPVREGEPEPDIVPTSYVPFRNAHILATATSWAEVLGASALFIGAVWEDSSGYPDCRPAFYEAFEAAIDAGTRPETRIAIHTPVIHMAKHQIVRKGVELGVPFELTWSCYQAEVVACGRCESCRLRLAAFARAGVTDPLSYAS